MTELKGHHVLAISIGAFGIIIAVNLTLAFNAVRTFPGLEVKNSYVASQSFDADRTAQTALGWQVEAWLEGDALYLEFLENGNPIQPKIEKAVFGRATSTQADQTPAFRVIEGRLVAPVDAGPGNWNLRVRARAENGTQFVQRIVVRSSK